VVSSVSAPVRAGQTPQPAPSRGTAWIVRRPSFATVVLVVPVVFMALVYALPLGRVLVQGFTDPAPGIGNFVDAFRDPLLLRVLWITVRISIEVAIVTLLLGFPVAVYMSTLPPRVARIVALFVIIPFWTSVLVRSFAWIVLLGDNGFVARVLQPFTGSTGGLLYTEGAVVVAMVHVLLPFMVLTVKGTLDQIDPTLVRAARTLGAGPVRAFLRVYLPLALPGMASGTLLVFIMALGYYITPALVGGPGQTTIAMLIAQKVNTTFEWGMAAALATILLVLSVGLYLVVRRFTRVEGLVGRI
jgi:ABC-type spermidine/putrescine transport system permease subunit I